MKLLITTQIVDREDPILGFFHEWLIALAPRFEQIEVICLKEGNHALPSNVRVHSLGKEQGARSWLLYAKRFLTLITKLEDSYDTVLVHMNPEYVLLGGVFWKLRHKKVFLWYNHPQGGLRLSIALLWVRGVFHTSPYAVSSRSKKSIRMPAGIDTELFHPTKKERTPFSIYLQGRVAPSKRVNTACEALILLRARDIQGTLTVVGPEDEAYVHTLKERYATLLEDGALTFLGPRPNRETPAAYGSHMVSINLAAAGHYDKTVLESLSCETPAIVGSRAFEGIVHPEWAGHDTPEKLADALEHYFRLPNKVQQSIGSQGRDAVVRKESLPALVERLAAALRN